MGPSSSAKKVAKVAEGSRKTKVRDTKGRVFPVAIVSTVILGSLLIWYARDKPDVVVPDVTTQTSLVVDTSSTTVLDTTATTAATTSSSASG